MNTNILQQIEGDKNIKLAVLYLFALRGKAIIKKFRARKTLYTDVRYFDMQIFLSRRFIIHKIDYKNSRLGK